MIFPVRDYVGYGAEPPRVVWPDEARVVISVVVNYEEGAEWYPGVQPGAFSGEISGSAASNQPARLRSTFEYGSRAGVWRLLRLFARHQIHVTVFACAIAFEANPAVARAVTAAGHDICGHGYWWEPMHEMDPVTERERIRQTVASIERTSGQRPVGWFPNVGGTSEMRRTLLAEGGFLYDSDEHNDDLPYYVAAGDQPWLVIPYTLDTNDAKFWRNGFLTGEDYFQYLRETFDTLYEEGADSPKMMSVGLHCRITGRPGRANGLDRFLAYARQHDRVWFARRGDIARWWREHYPPPSTH